MRPALVQDPVVIDETNGGELFQLCASASMFIYAIKKTKLEVNGNLVTLQPDGSQLLSKNDLFTKHVVCTR